MADSNLDIKIRTSADTAGASAAAASLKGVEAASKGSATATVTQAKAASQLGESFEKGAAAGRVLSEVSRGNVMAIGQLGAVFKAVGEAFKTNPLFLIGSLAATLVLPVIAKIGAGWEAQKKKAEDAGKAAADAATAAVDAIEKKRDNASAQYFHDIENAATNARSQIDAVTNAIVAQTDAEEAFKLAEVDANTKLTESERLLEKLFIQEEARQKRLQIQVDVLNQNEADKRSAATTSAAAADQRRAEESASGRYSDFVRNRSPAMVQAELDKLKKEEASKVNTDLNYGFTTTQRRADLEAELADATANYADRQKAAQDALLAATEKRKAAEQKAADDAAALATEQSNNTQKRRALQAQENSAANIDKLRLITISKKGQSEVNANAAGVAELAPGILADTQRAAKNPLVFDPALKELNKAVAKAAQAALDGGTTLNEAEALVSALEKLAEGFRVRQLKDTEISKRIAAVEAKIAGLRN